MLLETDDGACAPPNRGQNRIVIVLAGAILGLYVLFGCFVATNIHHRLDPSGAPLFYDFSAFYQAGGFADAGHPAAAYDDRAMIAAERAAFPGATARLPWNYPPTFQLLLMPFAALPYVAGWLLWTGALYGLYALLSWQLVAPGRRWLLLLAPGAAVNLLMGQNGLLSTALLGGGVMMLARRPIVGGALLGLMVYKPHFAVLIPLVLICGRAWRALFAAAASAAMLSLTALLVLGAESWFGFLHKALQPSAIFESSSSTWRSIPSVMIMARSLGLDAGLSAACHWAVALAAISAALWVWRKSDDGRIRAGALAAATLLVTPYLRTYDLALLILPIAALAPKTYSREALGEQTVIAFAWLLPAILLLAPPPIQMGPLAAIALLGLVVRRVGQARATGDTGAQTLAQPLPATP